VQGDSWRPVPRPDKARKGAEHGRSAPAARGKDAPCGRPGTRDDEAGTSEPQQIAAGTPIAGNDSSRIKRYLWVMAVVIRPVVQPFATSRSLPRISSGLSRPAAPKKFMSFGLCLQPNLSFPFPSKTNTAGWENPWGYLRILAIGCLVLVGTPRAWTRRCSGSERISKGRPYRSRNRRLTGAGSEETPSSCAPSPENCPDSCLSPFQWLWQ